MTRVTQRRGPVAVVLGMVLILGTAHSATLAPEKLPERVATTFRTTFPNATIDKLDADEEDGVMIYDFEFHVGDRDKETDITANGTMIESTLVIPRDKIPAPAMKGIQAAAKGATLGRCEWMETFYELKAGKTIAMAKPVIKYAAEMTKNGKQAEVVVATDGKVVEAPEWEPIPPVKAPSGKTGK